MTYPKALLLVAAVSLASCASRPENVIAPVAASAPGASSVDLLVATTRRSVDAPGELYSGERGGELSFSNIVVSIPPDNLRKAGEVQWPSNVPGDPATDFVATRVSRLGAANAREWIRTHVAANRKRHVLVFVHGFNNRFDDAVFRFAQIVHNSGAAVTPVLFTWPSRGSMFAYGYDHESAMLSRDELEELLNMLAKDPAVGEIDILAHSMGTWLVMETLRQMAIRDRHIPAKIDDVILASPDIDVDVFENELADMRKKAPKITLFVSREDRALAASRWVWGSDGRLGALDPQAEPYKTRLSAEHVSVVDLSEHEAGDTFSHNKFADRPEVVRLLGQRLENGQALGDFREGIVDRVVGATAGEVSEVETALEKAESTGDAGSGAR